MTIVLEAGQSVDALLAAGAAGCPSCSGRLRSWGRARRRVVRGPSGEWGHRPPRVRCSRCGVTHVVLPPDVLVRRRDAVVVVGRAWRLAAAGAGVRRVAAAVGVPMETVRAWLRSLRAQAATAGCGGQPPGGALSRALADLEAQAGAAGVAAGGDDLWRFAAHRSQGLLLRNTS
jgi:hypothetical protein